MGYEPLHHKYRPQTFAQLVGQGAIATTLSSALNQQRIAPAYLFCGPRGTGKTSSARILAKSLNCISGDRPTAEPCGVCEICTGITKGAILDVIEIDAASNTGVDNIRELIERAQFAPVQCRYKVYIIDEVHMLSTAAFNALLKTLEEPPDRVVFILATTDPQRVLPTIISRCQRFDFRRIALPDMITHLGAIARQEAIDIADEALQLVAQVSQGGLRDAESLLDQLSLTDGQISIDHVWDLVGAVPERDLLALVQAIATDDGIAVLDNARHLMDRGREPLIVLQNLAGFYRDLLIAKTASDRQDLVAITPPTWAKLCTFAQTTDLAFILQGQKRLRESEVQVKNTTQPRLWLEITLMGLLPSAILSSSAAIPASPQPHPASNPNPQTASSSTPVPPAISTPTPAPPPLPTVPTVPTPAPAPPTCAPTPAPTPVPTPPPLSSPTPPLPHSPTPPLPHSPTSPPASLHTPEQCDRLWQQVTALVEPPIARTLFQQQGRLVAFDGAIAQVTIKSKQLMRLAEPRIEKLAIAFEKVLQQSVRVTMVVASMDASSPGVSELPSPPPAVPPSAPPPSAPPPSSSVPQISPPSVSPPPPSSPPTPSASTPPNPDYPSSPAAAPQNPIVPDPPPSASSSISPTPTPPPFIPEDALTQSINRFASMFNGEVVELDDGDLDLLPPTGDPQQTSASEAERDDAAPSAPPPFDEPPPSSGPSYDPDVPF